MLQVLFAFGAGVLTVGAPCILPVLPIVLAGTVGEKSRTRPLFIALGFIVTFTLAGLLVSHVTRSLMLSPDVLRDGAVVLLGLFGFSLLWSRPFDIISGSMVGVLGKAQAAGARAGPGNGGGFLLGILLGLVWTPCAGPVLGSILTLLAGARDLARAGILLLAYAIGAGLPMLIIGYGGQYVTTRVLGIARHARTMQKVFGVLLIILAALMYFQYDILAQTKLLGA